MTSPDDTRTGGPTAAPEPAELVRLRVLWYALRARGLDACGAPGIAYDRPVVQSSPQQPAAPHGYGMGHARDPVTVRLDALSGEAAVTLRWYRAYPAQASLDAGHVGAILDALARELAPAAVVLAWGVAASREHRTATQVQAHVTSAARTWARARMARAWTAWTGEAAKTAEGTGT